MVSFFEFVKPSNIKISSDIGKPTKRFSLNHKRVHLQVQGIYYFYIAHGSAKCKKFCTNVEIIRITKSGLKKKFHARTPKMVLERFLENFICYV
ncbi:hypothetical protein BpHYR1_040802 [Brachionus plicatilis]|uniref:Uncharacterized protein n=1 Tax=Brachionus plicatilis TaxID=10195 RepID=A0A3M7RK52_BRAPC|nr:hypothetical protein BpHYR1_040802 [Brachionus plicatilis]